MSTAVEIACRDGVRLAGDHFPAVGDAQGSIVVACALGVRRAFYQRFAVLAAASGYEVLLFSYRGSEGDDPAVASYRLADWGREDIDAALAWCRARAPELPRYFVGHSIGAQLLGLAGQASGLSGAAFVAGSFPYWRRWRGRQRWQMFGLFCVAVPLLTGLLRRFPSRFFGLGSLDMPSHFMRDWARWVRQPDYLLAPRFGLQRQGYEALDIPVASFLFEDDDYGAVGCGGKASPGLCRGAPGVASQGTGRGCGRAFRAVPQRGVAEGVARLLQEAARRGVSRV